MEMEMGMDLEMNAGMDIFMNNKIINGLINGKSLSDFINEKLENSQKIQNRNYIGASSIGHPCNRNIWYGFKGNNKKPLTSKQIKTFSIGHALESVIKNKIVESGIKLIDPTEEQIFSKENKLFKGSYDAIIIINDKKSILEIKTANNSSFQNFVKKGLRSWNEQYYAQIQSYMGMSEIHSSYLIAINKDTSELYDEYVGFDEIFYDFLCVKSNIISSSIDVPEKINKNPMFYICNMCQYKEECHK